jgi:hypothetical protein
MYFAPFIYTSFPVLALVISKVKLLSLMHSFIPNLDTIYPLSWEWSWLKTLWRSDEKTWATAPAVSSSVKYHNKIL